MPEALDPKVWEALDTIQQYCADQAAESGWDVLPNLAADLIRDRIRPDYPEVADYLEAAMNSQDLMLVGDELTEGHEELRSGHSMSHKYYNEKGKPEGVPSEVSDAIIRMFHLMGRKGVLLGSHMKEKLDNNAKRGQRHGGRSF